MSASTVKLPDGPASVRGLAQDPTFDVFTGRVGYSVGIEVPSGPGGLAPKLGLEYSGELGNGVVGVGWSLGGIRIDRSLRLGVPTYDDAIDEFDLVGIGGGGRLVRDPDQPDHYWVEGKGTSIKVVRSNARFEVTDKDGVHYFLGNSSASREEESGRTSSWMVDWVRDLSGNQIDYHYVKTKNRLYLSAIDWGPKQNGVSIFGVTLQYQARTDVIVSYRAGFAISTDSRLQEVDVRSFGHQLRAYHLGYDLPALKTLALSRLARVEMTGVDGAGSLPALTFEYGGPQQPVVQSMAAASGWMLNARGVSLADVDGDGEADLLRLEAGNHEYKQGRGNAFGAAKPISGAEDVDLESSALIDLDGDARPELVRIVDDTWRAYRLVGTTWQSMGVWAGTRGVGLRAPDATLVDLNGDGRVDVVRPRGTSISVAFGGPTGLGPFAAMPPISPENTEVQPGQPNVRFQDMNGDGLADVVWLTDAWMKIFLGRGDGTFVPFARSPYPWGQSAFDVSTLVLADLNRDGLTDLVRTDRTFVHWFRGEGDGRFTTFSRQAPRPDSGDSDVVVTVADLNGNGSLDIVWSSARGIWALDLAGDVSFGMLSVIGNGLGMTTTITYSTSGELAVAADKAGSPWTRRLPTSIPIPVRVEVDPGAGTPHRVYERSVRDGFWDGVERRFGGFLEGKLVTVGAAPLTTLVDETTFNEGAGNDRELRGKPVTTQSSSAAGLVFSTTSSSWEAVLVGGLPDDPLLRKAALRTSQTFVYEGASVPFEIRTDYEFDGEVRPTVEHEMGRVDVVGDEAVIRRVFGSDDASGVRDRLVSEQTEEANGTIRAATRTYYGDQHGTPLGLGQIGDGFVRQVDGFLSTTNAWIPQTSKDYDACGNPSRIYEAGVERRFTFDARCVHPLTETITRQAGEVPLAWSMTWDEVRALPATVSDPSGDVRSMSYDEVSRPAAVFINSATTAYMHYAYDWTPPQPSTTTWVFDGDQTQFATQGTTWPSGPQWRPETAFSNGAGEPLYSSAPLGTRFIVSGWKERDERGQVVRVAEPFYSQTATPAAPTSNARTQLMSYDASRRLVTQTLPNGATKTVTYHRLGQRTDSPELGPVTGELDGLMRPVHTERDTGVAVEVVDAQYDAAGRILKMTLQNGEAVHSFDYDTLGRLSHAYDPDTGNRDLSYNDANFLIRHDNGEGQSVYFDYDDAGRLVRRGETLAPTPASDYTYVYDLESATLPGGCHAASRLASVAEPNGVVKLCYDELGRTTTTARTISLPNAATVGGSTTSAYSLSGLVLSDAFDDGFATAYRYDGAGRIVAVSSGGTDLWVADGQDDLDGAARVLNERYGNEATQVYKYDPLGLTSNVTVKSPSATVLYDVAVTRNAYGAPTLVIDSDQQGADHNASFSYDLAGRLTRSTLGAAGAGQLSFTYAYDALQNMTSRGVAGPQDIGVLTGVYKYGERGYGPRQLTSVIP